MYISFINVPELDHFMVNLEKRKNLVRITRYSIQTSRQYSNSIRTNGILNQLILYQFKPLPPLVLPPIHPHFPPSSGPPPPSPKSLSIYNWINLNSQPKILFFWLYCFSLQRINKIRYQISNTKYQISDFIYQISDASFHISDIRFYITNTRCSIKGIPDTEYKV